DSKKQSSRVDFTIRMHGGYDLLPDSKDPKLPVLLFQEATDLITEIRHTLKERSGAYDIMKNVTTDALMGSIFSSNYIERVGLSLDETIKICRRIFNGEDVDADDIEERSEEYERQMRSYIGDSIKDLGGIKMVIRSRRE